VKERLERARGREYWRSLEELACTEEFEELLHREFPQHAAEWDESTDRRTFLKLMGASLALAGLTGCSYQPPETIVPYVRQPEDIIPGKPLFFATASPMPGGAIGLLARSHMGRPIKLEGNDLHPASQGSTDAYAQASILTLYDPDRSQTVVNRGEVRSYTSFLGEVATLLESLQNGGRGLRFLAQSILSPTMAAQLEEIFTRYPNARLHQWEAAGAHSARQAARERFGDFTDTVYHFDRADRVLSLDSDFLSCGPASLRYARDFAARRRVREGSAEINRLYAVESTPTNTGACADHRLPVRPSQVERVASLIASRLGAGGEGGEAGLNEGQLNFVKAVVEDLGAHRGSSLVIAGDEQTPRVHALAHAINAALGGQTVTYMEPVEFAPADHVESLRELVDAIDAGEVEMLVVIGGNPVYDTPVDLKLDARRMLRVPWSAHLSLYDDETSELCHWHVPEAHFLEAWSDTRAFDGTASVIQPLIEPLYNGKSVHEFLAAFSTRPDRSGYDIVRDFWRKQLAGGANASGLKTNTGRLAAATAGGHAPAAQGPAPAVGPVPATGASAEQQPTARPTPTATPTAARPSATPAGAQTQSAGAQSQGTAAQNAGAAQNTGAATGTSAAGAAADAAFEKAWRKAVHDGVIPGTQARERVASGGGAQAGTQSASAASSEASGAGSEYEIVFRADPSIYDGRFANNGWLQELPKPLTKLTWDNAALVSPATAEKLNLGVEPDGAVEEGGPRRVNCLTAKGGEITADVVRLSFKGQSMTMPVFITPGQPDDVVTVHLGYGRWRAGRVGGREGTFENPTGPGFNVYKLRHSDAMWHGAGLQVAPTGEAYQLACTQIHFRMEGRDIVRSGSYERWQHDPEMAPATEHQTPPEPAGKNREPAPPESMYQDYDYSEREAEGFRGYKWGMVIDLGTCVGCNACIVACQAENNIPVVGKEQVMRSREMHWLRVDAYFRGAVDNPAGVHFMPVPCMHCENAPCEPVCPVHATVHSSEGLNDMVYNRCVGTRYCSNNCPYKVRRFNFLLFQDWETPSFKMLRNPEVSVRSRGVMEKCTYCVQRIEFAKIEAEKRGDKVKDGEIVTACQQACPTEAIVFGDLNDPNARVTKMAREPRDYGLLADLNTRPRTTYLAAVRNPNPALKA
jgi:molybdopterin-containing oxidoreductase family iron-sulfur binding subunit